MISGARMAGWRLVALIRNVGAAAADADADADAAAAAAAAARRDTDRHDVTATCRNGRVVVGQWH